MIKQQKWTTEDTANAIDWSIKMQRNVIDCQKKIYIDLSNALQADPTNTELKTSLDVQETKITKLENRLARFISASPELLGA